MNRNMYKWIQDTISSPVKQAMPVLSFPAIQLMGISVKDLINSSDLQSKGMLLVAERTPSAASVSLMDLSVEAECFGSKIFVTDGEVPSVVGAVVTDESDANALEIPKIGACRTGLYIESIRRAVHLISDRPVFAGMIGPFSLAARLMDVSQAMVNCYDEPDMVHTVMNKVTRFLTNYALSYKEAGADGIIMAEPVTGLLSPDLADEFSHPYVKQIIDAVQDESFAVIYHNCGGAVKRMSKGIYALGACGYHFGNAVRMEDMLDGAPENSLVMGNVSPAEQFRNGTPESIREVTINILNANSSHDNFVISSGCDIPPLSPWENIDAFYKAVEEFYKR